MRADGRKNNQIRSVVIKPNYILYPEGSTLIEIGNTKVLCNVSIEESIPYWMQKQGVEGGWITAEYSLLPRSTHQRTPRENSGLSGRTQEIRRLIGRSLRACVDLKLLGPRTFIIDCDVLQADGGTRTASITGAYVALAIAIKKLIEKRVLPADFEITPVAAISAGIVAGENLLDLTYQEDSHADVDINVVMNAKGEFIEIQSTAEKNPFTYNSFLELIELTRSGISELLRIQESYV
ncbi:MAG: ribonuclease PH [Anaerolineaceae bacterium]